MQASLPWPNSSIYGRTCALSSLRLFVEAKCAVQGSCLKPLWLTTPVMNFQGKSIITFLMNTLQRCCFSRLQKPLVPHINQKALIANRSLSPALSRYISVPPVDTGLQLNCCVITRSRRLLWPLHANCANLHGNMWLNKVNGTFRLKLLLCANTHHRPTSLSLWTWDDASSPRLLR